MSTPSSQHGFSPGYQAPPLSCPFCQAPIAPYHLRCRTCGKELPLDRPRAGATGNWGLPSSWQVHEALDGSVLVTLRPSVRKRVLVTGLLGVLVAVGWCLGNGFSSRDLIDLAIGLLSAGGAIFYGCSRSEWIAASGHFTRRYFLGQWKWRETVTSGEFVIERDCPSKHSLFWGRHYRWDELSGNTWRLVLQGNTRDISLLSEQPDFDSVHSFALYLSWKTGFPLRLP